MRHPLHSPKAAPSRPGRTRVAAAALSPLLLVTLAACGDDSSDSGTSAESGTASASMSPATPPASGGDALVVAAATARSEVNESTVFSIDQQNGGDWEVTLVTDDGREQDVTVSSDGRSVTSGPVEDTDDTEKADREERIRLLDVPVNVEAAVQAAAADSASGGAEPTGAELDEENGTAVWEVQFGEDTADEVTVFIDANNASVLRTEHGD